MKKRLLSAFLRNVLTESQSRARPRWLRSRRTGAEQFRFRANQTSSRHRRMTESDPFRTSVGAGDVSGLALSSLPTQSRLSLSPHSALKEQTYDQNYLARSACGGPRGDNCEWAGGRAATAS